MNLSDYIKQGFTVIVDHKKTRQKILDKFPDADVMTAYDDAIGGERLLIDSWCSQVSTVMAAVAKFKPKDVIIMQFTKKFFIN